MALPRGLSTVSSILGSSIDSDARQEKVGRYDMVYIWLMISKNQTGRELDVLQCGYLCQGHADEPDITPFYWVAFARMSLFPSISG